MVEEPKNQPISEYERISSILEETIDKKIREQKREGKLQLEMEVKSANVILGEIHEGQENMFEEMLKQKFKLVSIYVLASMHMKLHLRKYFIVFKHRWRWKASMVGSELGLCSLAWMFRESSIR